MRELAQSFRLDPHGVARGLVVAAFLMVAIEAPVYADCQNVRALGAVGDGKHDDTAAIQSAVQAVITGQLRGGTVCLPAGDYRITKTIVISDVQGIRLIGEGGATRLI